MKDERAFALVAAVVFAGATWLVWIITAPLPSFRLALSSIYAIGVVLMLTLAFLPERWYPDDGR